MKQLVFHKCLMRYLLDSWLLLSFGLITQISLKVERFLWARVLSHAVTTSNRVGSTKTESLLYVGNNYLQNMCIYLAVQHMTNKGSYMLCKTWNENTSNSKQLNLVIKKKGTNDCCMFSSANLKIVLEIYQIKSNCKENMIR